MLWTQAQDMEANAFAMELLMPFDWIVRDAADLCLTDDAGIAKLAKRYRVPTSVMAVRVGEVRRELEMRDAAKPGLGGDFCAAEMKAKSQTTPSKGGT